MAHHPSQRNHSDGHELDLLRARVRNVDDLAGLSHEQLSALYAGGQPPQLGVLAGQTRGRLLSIPALLPLRRRLGGSRLLGRSERLFDRLVAGRLMPWQGKTFAPPSEPKRTRGHNRVLGRELLPFEAHVEKSALDHQPTLLIRYELPENPTPLRRLRDELREITRGIWMGPAYVQGPSGPRVLLWFALQKA